MFKDERQFEQFIRDLPFDDRPDPAHRDKLQEKLLGAAVRQTPRQSTLKIGRSIMKNNFVKLTTAAAVIIVILAIGWLASSPKTPESISAFTLLARACAAEQSLFTGQEIVHIINEIVVYPTPEESNLPDRLKHFDLPSKVRDNIDTANSWLDYNWLPMTSLQANGRFRFNQLKFSTDVDQPYTISDQAWYDPVTGRFVRIMKTGENVIFANSYDGEFIHLFEGVDGSLQLVSEPVAKNFSPPQNPAAFLGLTAGFKSSIPQDDSEPIQEITEDTLENGSPVCVYKLGFADLFGDLNTYWLFKVRDDDSTVAEMEFVLAGATQLVIRRVLTEPVDVSEVSWNLAELDRQDRTPQAGANVTIMPDMVIPNVSVQHMVERASYETYIFNSTPAWTNDPVIVDCLDSPSPPHRMFSICCRADDGRDVVLVQAQTYNKTFGQVYRQGQLVYTSPNGFKVWVGGPEKWWTEILLRSAGLTPAEERRGYGLESPAGTFPALAINGRLSDEELHQLIDSLEPAKKHLEN